VSTLPLRLHTPTHPHTHTCKHPPALPHPTPQQVAQASGLGNRVRFELQYRKATGSSAAAAAAAAAGPSTSGAAAAGWSSLVASDPSFDVTGLAAGTKYAFRGRGGMVNVVDGRQQVDFGKWSVESVYATSGACL